MGVRKAIIRNSVKPNHINIFCDELKRDKDFIVGREESNLVKEPAEEYNSKNKIFRKVAFYDTNISAGNVEFLANGQIKGLIPDYYLHVPVNVDADISFPVFGSAMFPEINNGDRVALKIINDWSFFNYGMKYMIITNEQSMIRYLKKSQIKGNVLLTSKNDEFEDIEIPVKSIKSILQVRYICKLEI